MFTHLLLSDENFAIHLSGGAAEVYSVVLLTDDRNLRVKAHANNLPVRDIPAFMQLLA